MGLPQGDTHMPTVFEMKKDSATNKDIMVGKIENKESGNVILCLKKANKNLKII